MHFAAKIFHMLRTKRKGEKKKKRGGGGGGGLKDLTLFTLSGVVFKSVMAQQA